MLRSILSAGLLLLVSSWPTFADAQRPPDPAVLLDAQREAMVRFSGMDGVWRGEARTMLPSGEWHAIVQTERAGPMLDGTIRVVEGRGYEQDGRLAFNALGIISFDPATSEYRIRSYAQGRQGDYPIEPTDDGFRWEIEAGPVTMRYTASIQGDTWHEVGDRIMPDGRSMRFHEMTLSRVGDSDWPATGAIAKE